MQNRPSNRLKFLGLATRWHTLAETKARRKPLLTGSFSGLILKRVSRAFCVCGDIFVRKQVKSSENRVRSKDKRTVRARDVESMPGWGKRWPRKPDFRPSTNRDFAVARHFRCASCHFWQWSNNVPTRPVHAAGTVYPLNLNVPDRGRWNNSGTADDDGFSLFVLVTFCS